MPVREIGPANIYEAYAGPETGGFSLVPQSAVPDVGVDDETRRRLLGDEFTPPSWYVGTNPKSFPAAPAAASVAPAPKKGEVRELGPAAALQPPVMVNETLFPKGHAPRQLTQDEANQFALQGKLFQQQQARAAEEAKGRGEWENFALSAQKRMANNILGLPTLAADVVTYPSRAIASGITKGELPNFSVFPQVGVDEIAAGVRGVEGLLQGQDPREAYRRARENIDLAEGARVAARPTSTFWGNVGGDVASLVAGRVPFARAAVKMTTPPYKLEAIRRSIEMLPPGAKRMQKALWNLPVMKDTLRGLGKAAETGLEGATLALLNQGDPISTGAYAAGGQAAGSLAMSLLHHPFRGLGALGAGIVGWQMIKELTPGGRDRILESIEHVIRHATWGTVLGGAAGLLGAGRYRGSRVGVEPGSNLRQFSHRYAEDLPAWTEGVNAALRANPISIIEQITNDMKAGKPVLGPILENLSNNVSMFTDAELRRLSKAMEGSNLRDTVQKMLENPDFKARMGL